jgi:hypothetical protein
MEDSAMALLAAHCRQRGNPLGDAAYLRNVCLPLSLFRSDRPKIRECQPVFGGDLSRSATSVDSLDQQTEWAGKRC